MFCSDRPTNLWSLLQAGPAAVPQRYNLQLSGAKLHLNSIDSWFKALPLQPSLYRVFGPFCLLELRAYCSRATWCVPGWWIGGSRSKCGRVLLRDATGCKGWSTCAYFVGPSHTFRVGVSRSSTEFPGCVTFPGCVRVCAACTLHVGATESLHPLQGRLKILVVLHEILHP